MSSDALDTLHVFGEQFSVDAARGEAAEGQSLVINDAPLYLDRAYRRGGQLLEFNRSGGEGPMRLLPSGALIF